MDQFSTAYLNGVVEELRQPSSFLLDTFFPGEIRSDTVEINFDVDSSKPRITPFVHPWVAGKIVANAGFQTSSFKPAYAKDTRIFRPSDALTRAIGEKIGGSLSAEQRRQQSLVKTLDDQLKMLTRREVVMASEALRTGAVTVAGEGYPTVTVDFGRLGSHTITLTGNDCWDVTHADSDPLNDIEDTAILFQDDSGTTVDVVVFAPSAWRAMRKRLAARDELKLIDTTARGNTSSIDLAPGNGQKVRFIGMLGQIELYVYDEAYVDDNGTTQRVMPSGTVLFGSRDMEGVRHYGAIQDEDATDEGQVIARYYAKSWKENNPSVRMVQLQSAPLPVPYRVNASACMHVLT